MLGLVPRRRHRGRPDRRLPDGRRPGPAPGRGRSPPLPQLVHCRHPGPHPRRPRLVAIETLAPGDLVLARNEQTGELSYRPIHHVIVTADKQAYDLRLDRGGLVETIGVTSEHPLWVRGRGWTKAYRLAPGDQVFTDSGQWARVVSNSPGGTRAYVYNLDVADDHTFFVGQVGAWVHNCALTPTIAATTRLAKLGEGTRRAHFAQANKALLKQMKSNPSLARSIRARGITIPRSATGKVLGKSPANWTWHHVPSRPGVMQLIPRSQHSRTFRKLLHPDGVGGFHLWGKLGKLY